MSDNNSTPTGKPAKPAKPAPDFPLFPHAAGYWAKKIRGRLVYFGRWEDPEGALRKYQEERQALESGRTPRPEQAEGATVRDAVNAFRSQKEADRKAGYLSARTLADYVRTCDLVIASMGAPGRLVDDLRPDDFARLRNAVATGTARRHGHPGTRTRWGPSRLGTKLITFTKSIFKFAYDSGLIDRPVRFGPTFKQPPKAIMRRLKFERGEKFYPADQVRRLLDAANPRLKAMILLGVNCGFNNSDCGKLPLSALHLDAGWINFPRAKNWHPRRCPLWPETVQALRDVLADRHTPKDPAEADRVFVTKFGNAYRQDQGNDPVGREFRHLVRALGINGQKGLGYGTLRHVFETVGGHTRDQVAVNFVMGHADSHISAEYREHIEDSRLLAVSDCVRAWLFPAGSQVDAGSGGITPCQGG